MRFEHLPLVQQVVETGAEDRVFDGLLFTGPLVIVLIALLGRSVFTRTLATLYIVIFIAYTLAKGSG